MLNGLDLFFFINLDLYSCQSGEGGGGKMIPLIPTKIRGDIGG